MAVLARRLWRDRSMRVPEGFMLRANSTDAEIFHEVYAVNAYELPNRFKPNTVLIDIGAHIGSFGYTALQRGASKVYCFEVLADNIELLRKNLSTFGPKADIRQQAVWRSDVLSEPLLYAESPDANNFGGGNVWDERAAGAAVTAVGLDSILLEASNNGKRRINLLKLDCEGSEFPILLTATRLDLVDEICGEFHEFNGPCNRNGQVPARLNVRNQSQLTMEDLEQYLTQQGFNVYWRRWQNTQFGTFKAQRPAPEPIDEPFFHQQLQQLRQAWDVHPQPQPTLLGRVRSWLGWQLLKPELQQISTMHAALVRTIDSLTAQMEHEQHQRQELQAQLRMLEAHSKPPTQ